MLEEFEVEDLTLKLKDRHLSEIKARCELLDRIAPLYDGGILRILESPGFWKTGLSLEEVLSMSEPDILEIKDKAYKIKDMETELFWNDVLAVQLAMKDYDINADLGLLLKERRLENKCSGRYTDKEIINLLKYDEKVLDSCESGDVDFLTDGREAFLSRFSSAPSQRKFSVSEREKKMNDPSSRLYRKRINSEKLREEREKAINTRISARRKIGLPQSSNSFEDTCHAEKTCKRGGTGEV